MRGRGKRMKTGTASSGESSRSRGSDLFCNHPQMQPPEDQDVLYITVIFDLPTLFVSRWTVLDVECGSFASRCPIRLIHEVVSKFDLQKRDLVKSIGFQGILHFPPMKQINRKFALWIMSCVDEASSTLKIGNHIRIRFTKGDVGNVLGIPSSGKTVLDSRYYFNLCCKRQGFRRVSWKSI